MEDYKLFDAEYRLMDLIWSWSVSQPIGNPEEIPLEEMPTPCPPLSPEQIGPRQISPGWRYPVCPRELWWGT